MTRYQKQILELRLNGFSSQEIAEKMEVSISSIHTQLYRMRKKGIMVKKEKSIIKIRNEKIMSEFKKGRSVNDICEFFKISQQTFYRIKRSEKNEK